MFDYLQQFNKLPQDLRDQVSSPSAMALLSELENKYRVDLAIIVMKVMIKSLTIKNLPAYFVSESGLNGDQAEALSRELKEKIFASVADYLGILSEMRALDLDKDISVLIKETGLILPSENLISRFKNILATYLKGVRSKIDTRATLAKDIKIGGLSLSETEIERVFKVCEAQKFKSLEFKLSSPLASPASRLDKIIAAATPTGSQRAEVKSISTTEYNLKQALASGQVKKVETLDTKHELPAPEKELSLPLLETEAVKSDLSRSLKASPDAAPTPITAPAKITGLTEPKPEKIASPQAPAPASLPKIEIPQASRAKIELPKIVIPKAETPAPAPTPIPPRPTVINRPVVASSSAKPKMHDIKPAPKVMGPIEELQFLDLINFRRLGKTPAEISAKIFAKIKLLEREGYERMVAGVKAWRQSPVNRLYLRLGQEAIAKNLNLKGAIEARQKANQEYLSLEEIEAIVMMNSKLVF